MVPASSTNSLHCANQSARARVWGGGTGAELSQTSLLPRRGEAGKGSQGRMWWLAEGAPVTTYVCFTLWQAEQVLATECLPASIPRSLTALDLIAFLGNSSISHSQVGRRHCSGRGCKVARPIGTVAGSVAMCFPHPVLGLSISGFCRVGDCFAYLLHSYMAEMTPGEVPPSCCSTLLPIKHLSAGFRGPLSCKTSGPGHQPHQNGELPHRGEPWTFFNDIYISSWYNHRKPSYIYSTDLWLIKKNAVNKLVY